MNPSLIKLEDKLHELVQRLRHLNGENRRLNEELALSREEYVRQSRLLEEAERSKEAESARVSLLVHAEKSQEELSSKIQYQEQQIQLLEKERLNLRDQIAFLQTTVQNKEREWKERLTEAETELEGKERLLEQYREESNAQGREAQNVRQELL